uniref:ORF48b n=1 Tax=Pinus koraiensis TaxID=88728 RepID=Q85WS4_PINKO|nr:ORF48b [Pinus koraiensis]AAO74145.1 ORF48b [Pinus koraiensis]
MPFCTPLPHSETKEHSNVPFRHVCTEPKMKISTRIEAPINADIPCILE